MTPLKDHNNFPVMNPKDMKICDIPNKDFKIAILGSLVSYKKYRKTVQLNQDNSTIKKRKRNLTKRNLREEPNKNSGAGEYSE